MLVCKIRIDITFEALSLKKLISIIMIINTLFPNYNSIMTFENGHITKYVINLGILKIIYP